MTKVKRNNISLELSDDMPCYDIKSYPDVAKPPMANTSSATPASPEDDYTFRSEMVLEKVEESTYVNLVAISADFRDNSPKCICAEGEPIGGYAYTPDSDQYLISCVDYLPLGVISAAFRLSVKGYAGKTFVPASESMIVNNASPSQRKEIAAFKDKYKNHSIEFVQSIYRI